jgi:hypothetical protein
MTQDITIHLTNDVSITVHDFEEALVADGVLRVTSDEAIHAFPLTSILWTVTTHD